MFTRTHVALVLLVALCLTTGISLRRWQNTRAEAELVDQRRLAHVRKLLAVRLERLPLCTWARDLLQTQAGVTARSLDPDFEDQHGPALRALNIARSCVPLTTAVDLQRAFESLGEEAERWAEAIDTSIRDLEIEIASSAR